MMSLESLSLMLPLLLLLLHTINNDDRLIQHIDKDISVGLYFCNPR